MSEAIADEGMSSDASSDKPKVVPRPGLAAWDMETPIPPAAEAQLDKINMVNPRMFAEDRWGEYFARLRAEDPVHFNDTEWTGRYWSLTRYDDIKAVDVDDENFSSEHGITLGIPVDAELPEGALDVRMFIAMDNPQHQEQRVTVAPIVAPMGVKTLEPIIRERVIKILDSLPIGEEFNWVEKVSIELTTQMLATLFDFPFEQRSKLTYWSDVATAVPGAGLIESEEERRDILIECLMVFTELFEQRKVNPGNDLVSMLAQGEKTKDLAPLEFLGNLMLLIVGGNDTTRNSISASVLGLNQFPAEYDKLRANTGIIPNMVAEIIRWQTPLAYMRRTANSDCVIGDKDIKAGDQILMWYVSGNRDDSHFDRPDDIIIDRANARQHLSFGFGVHRCMGNRLAEMQLRVLWEEIMKRFEFIEVVGEPERTMSSFVKGYTKLPVKLHAKA